MKSIIRQFKFFVAAIACGLLFPACDGLEPNDNYIISIEKPYVAGAPFKYLYANQIADSLVFTSTTPWAIRLMQGDDSWVNILGSLSGGGSARYRYGVSFDKNLTGESRQVYFRISSTDHPDKAYSTFGYSQYATRIDGSLGKAPLVKSITGSDGSSVNLVYDEQDRPVSVKLSAGTTKRTLIISYGKYDNTITVKEQDCQFVHGDSTFVINDMTLGGLYADFFLSAPTGNIFMPYLLYSMETTEAGQLQAYRGETLGSSRTVSRQTNYTTFSLTGMYAEPFDNGYIIDNVCGGFYTRRGFYLNQKGSIANDGKRLADSIAVVRHFTDGTDLSDVYTLTYSNVDNRAISVDVNQLIEGVATCDPYLLVSLLKFARQTSVIAKAEGKHNTFTTQSETDGNGVMRKFTVTDSNNVSVTYTFSY